VESAKDGGLAVVGWDLDKTVMWFFGNWRKVIKDIERRFSGFVIGYFGNIGCFAETNFDSMKIGWCLTEIVYVQYEPLQLKRIGSAARDVGPLYDRQMFGRFLGGFGRRFSGFHAALNEYQLPNKQAGLYESNEAQNGGEKYYTIVREPVPREWVWFVGLMCLCGLGTGLLIGWLVVRGTK